jgi:hypothetical protein
LFRRAGCNETSAEIPLVVQGRSDWGMTRRQIAASAKDRTPPESATPASDITASSSVG